MTETIANGAQTEKERILLPPMPGDMKTIRSSDQKNASFKYLQKSETPVKTGAIGTSVKDKLMRALGMRKVSPDKNTNKLSLFSGNAEAETNLSLSRVPEQTKAPRGLLMHEVSGGAVNSIQISREIKMNTPPLDNDRLTQRLIELETHVKEIHSAFDDFVLHSDKFLNYEQFLDIQNEVKEKILLLDKLEKSLEESKNMILKDAGYMDQIMEGFTHNKKRIEYLESRLNAISREMSANNHLPQNNLLNMVLPANAKYPHSAKTPDPAMIADIKNELAAFKKTEESRQNDFLKMQKTISSFDDRMNKISINLETTKKMIDEINLKIMYVGDKKETSGIDALRIQINDLTQRLADVDKRMKTRNETHGEAITPECIEENINTGCGDMNANIKSGIDAQARVLSSKVSGITHNKNADILSKKDAEKMNADILEVRTNIEQIKNALQGL